MTLGLLAYYMEKIKLELYLNKSHLDWDIGWNNLNIRIKDKNKFVIFVVRKIVILKKKNYKNTFDKFYIRI